MAGQSVNHLILNAICRVNGPVRSRAYQDVFLALEEEQVPDSALVKAHV